MFWDSSALVPILVAETRSSELSDLLARDRAPVVWWSSAIECRSALFRRWRERAFSEPELKRALARLEGVAEDLDQIAPTARLKERAGRAISMHPLRAADALQLAAALVWCDDTPAGESFVCLDDRLREAARGEGFDILPVASLGA